MRINPRSPAWALAAVVLVLSTGCSDDDDGGDGAAGSTTTAAAAGGSSAGRDAAQLNLAATGMNLVASDISLRAIQGGAAGYCRTDAPGELAPHRAALEAAADAEVRQRAGTALGDLDAVVGSCAGGGDPAALQQAIQRYNTSFERLRQRIDELLGPGG